MAAVPSQEGARSDRVGPAFEVAPTPSSLRADLPPQEGREKALAGAGGEDAAEAVRHAFDALQARVAQAVVIGDLDRPVMVAVASDQLDRPAAVAGLGHRPRQALAR